MNESERELIWTPEMVVRYWTAQRSDADRYFSFQVGRVLARRFAHFFKSNAAIVDYGAGNGPLVEDLMARGFKCAAIEHSHSDADKLNSRFNGNHRLIGAKTNKPADVADWSGLFDGAFLVEVVEHLYDDALQVCLSSVRNLLRPGGILIVTTPNEEDRSKSFLVSPESGLLYHERQHVRS